MKKIICCLFLMFLFTGNSASSASFKLTVAEDVKFISYNSTISNYPDLVAESHYSLPPVITLLKFKLTDNKKLDYAIKESGISSINLNIFRFRTDNDPHSQVYYSNDNTWTEGEFSSSHVDDYTPAYDNNSLVGNLPLVPVSVSSQQGWINTQLSINKFAADEDGIFSLIIANNNNSGHEDHLISLDQFLHRESVGGNYAAYLTINTNDAVPSPVPEPSSMILGLAGIGSLLGFKRKK